MERALSPRVVPRTVVTAMVALGALGLGAPASIAGAAEPWVPPPCPGAPGTQHGGDEAAGAWYRLDPILDAAGTLAGLGLEVGSQAGPTRSLRLPPESFASGPEDGLVLTGADDGRTSRLRLLDPVLGCETPLAVESDVVRSALLAPDRGSIYEHRVDRATRADLGVWRRPIGGGDAARVLPPLPADARFGPTFVTDLRVAGDGRVVVSACGMRACRTRVLEPATGRVSRVDGTGPALGVHGSTLVSMAPCAGLPCAILSTDLDDGGTTVLVARAGQADLAGDDGRLLLHEDENGSLRGRDLATGAAFIVADGGLAPVGRGSLATAGIQAHRNLVALAPGGRVRDGYPPRLFDPASRSLVTIEEVVR
jgi:hypothetical protein